MCIYKYILIYVYIHTYTQEYIHIYICTCIYIYVYVYKYIYIYTHMNQYTFTYACIPKCLCIYLNCKIRALPCDFFTKTPAFIFRIHIFLNAIALGLLPALLLICTPLPDGVKVIDSYHLFIDVFIYIFIYALIGICIPMPDGFKCLIHIIYSLFYLLMYLCMRFSEFAHQCRMASR